jgi:uncharacterized membrane protein YhaH (DUF805 family)
LKGRATAGRFLRPEQYSVQCRQGYQIERIVHLASKGAQGANVVKWIYLFCNARGRIGRKTFWIASTIIVVVEFATATVATAVAQKFGNETAGHTAADIVMFLFLFPQFTIAVKRAHDRNISTWLVSAWLVLLATTDVLDFFGWLPTRIDLNVFSVANLLVFSYTVIAGIVSLALLIELCFRRGTKGANRYGPDPLAIA